ncbi:BLUF domain-containing protein [Methylobacterium aquaticum]|uniref:BLUF domain-containing protein n=1 Tax=Methylobacterium aquaticum TaxID=270351 RepID=UPI003D182CC8
MMLGTGHLATLLATARLRNRTAAVTGGLVYTGLGFFQVLEGTRAGVQSIFDAILVDRRRHTLAVIAMDVAVERRFHGWSMGFLATTRELEDRLNRTGLGAAGCPEALDHTISD